MVFFHILLSLMGIPLSIAVAFKYFNIYDISKIIGIDIALIGAFFLILMQLLSYISIKSYNEGTTLMGKIIKTILAVPGVLYIVNMPYPLELPINLEIIIALFLFTEALYGLH